MADPRQECYNRRGALLVKNLKNRQFEAFYAETKEEALKVALSLIGKEETIGWGGALSCQQIGLIDALNNGGYHTFDRAKCTTQEERDQCMRNCAFADVFLTGANGLSMDGQMVNIDGTGNRVSAIVFGPKKVIVVAGMNKVCDTIEDAVKRARTVAAPMNKQRFPDAVTGCATTGKCSDCIAPGCICNQLLVTRHCRPAGRIQFIIVGEDLGF